jgi:hypothetical protein
MPRFFKRIFSENLFRREPDTSNVQQPRRVLVRNSSGMPDEHSTWKLSLCDAQTYGEEHVALKDEASVAESDMRILAPSQEQIPLRMQSRVRRRLSKRHRRPA